MALLVTLPLLSRPACAPCDAGIQTTHEGPQGLSCGPLLGFVVNFLLKFSPRLLKQISNPVRDFPLCSNSNISMGKQDLGMGFGASERY